MGRGNQQLAEQTALDAMRRAFDAVEFSGTVVIGRGEKGETPTLYVGEQVGSGMGPELDVAAEPLEGPHIVAQGRTNAVTGSGTTRSLVRYRNGCRRTNYPM